MKKDRYCVAFGRSSISDLTEREKDIVTEILQMAGIDCDVYVGAVHFSNHSK